MTSSAHATRPQSLDELAFLPITALAPLLERRHRFGHRVDDACISARLRKYGPKLNCVVTLTDTLALTQAAAADREIRAGRYKGPLHGIPWGAKDLFATKGIPTTWGAGPFRNQVFDYDATIVERLRDAGAVLVAKLSMGALAQGDRWFGGQTKNPWNPAIRARSDRAPVALRGSGLCDRCRTRRFRYRHRNTRIDHFTVERKWRHRASSNVRTGEPPRRDGAQLDDGQDWPDVPLG